MKCTILNIGIADCSYYRNGDCARTATCYDYRILRNKNNPEQFSTPPPFKMCPDCDGSGMAKTDVAIPNGPHLRCPTCHGTGRIPIWYTVEQWERLTVRKIPDEMPIWFFLLHQQVWVQRTFYESKSMSYLPGHEHKKRPVIATEAGRPPKDWRPE